MKLIARRMEGRQQPERSKSAGYDKAAGCHTGYLKYFPGTRTPHARQLDTAGDPRDMCFKLALKFPCVFPGFPGKRENATPPSYLFANSEMSGEAVKRDLLSADTCLKLFCNLSIKFPSASCGELQLIDMEMQAC